jgi:hypothetical protein
MSYSSTFADPFYGGAGLSPSVPWVFPVALAGRGLFIDLSQYERTTLPLLRPGSDQAAEPGESSRSNEGLWPRAASDWRFGAGQTYFDRATSSRLRFASSVGIDPWQEGTLRLLPDVELAQASAAGNLALLVVGDYLYRVRGAVVEFSDDAATWTAVTLTGVGAAVLDLTTDGSYVYACDGAGVWRVAAGSAGPVAAWSTADVERLWFANGRLLGAVADALVELDTTGTATPVKDHFNDAMRWVAVVGAPNGIYAACTAGVTSEVYYFGVNDNTGALQAGAMATPWIVGEPIVTMGFYGGLVFFGTAAGIRVGTINAQNDSLSYGALVAIAGGVSDFVFANAHAWFTWTNYDGTRTGVGRLGLDEFVEAERLVPAHASDLMAPGQGAVTAVVRYQGRTRFAVAGAGFYDEADQLVASGTIRSGWITYNDVEDKVAVAGRVRHEPLQGKVAMLLGLPKGPDYAMGVSGRAGTTEPSDSFGAGTKVADRFEVVLTLSRSEADPTAGPVVTMWQLLSLPTGSRTDEIIVPIMVSELVGDGGSEGAYNPFEVFTWLKALESSPAPVAYQEGEVRYLVRVDRVRVDPSKWTFDRSFYEGLIFVRLLTVEA